jgi:hypothetical protein
MSCRPQSGGCEKRFTDPLVAHLNELRGTKYTFLDCLDVNDNTKPQPETLYVDPTRGHELVIERKSISWPIDYPHRHGNDHFVAELFSAELADLPWDNALYEIGLPMLIKGTQPELQSFVAAAAAKIRRGWRLAAAGEVLRDRLNEKWWWAFRRVPDWDRDDDAPRVGLKFSWTGRMFPFENYVDSCNLPESLAGCLSKIFASCVKKFRAYSHAERILLIDPHGDLQHNDAKWWHDVFASHCPPKEIGEIWSGTFDEEWQGWSFERLH